MLHINFVLIFVCISSILILPCHSSTDDKKISAVEYGIHSEKIDNAYDKGKTIEHIDTTHNAEELSALADHHHRTAPIHHAIHPLNHHRHVHHSVGGVNMGGGHVVKAPTRTGSLYSSILNGGK
uniref:Uncharacterized protein n=1 Tax=Panagrolaimus sp. ES5 TaxID=591445 RepID=A0AC34FB35_9BILA